MKNIFFFLIIISNIQFSFSQNPEILFKEKMKLLNEKENLNIEEIIIDETLNLNLLEYSIFWFKKEEFSHLINRLQKEGKEKVFQSQRIFSLSILSGNIEVVKYLFSFQKRPYLENEIVFDVTDFIVNLNIAKSFINNDSEHLKLIPKNADVELLNFLHLKEINLNVKDKNGDTILKKCLDYPHIVSLLLQMGVNPNAKDSKGKTILDFQIEDLLLIETFFFNENEFQLDFETSKISVTQNLINFGAKKANNENPFCFILEELNKEEKKTIRNQWKDEDIKKLELNCKK